MRPYDHITILWITANEMVTVAYCNHTPDSVTYENKRTVKFSMAGVHALKEIENMIFCETQNYRV